MNKRSLSIGVVLLVAELLGALCWSKTALSQMRFTSRETSDSKNPMFFRQLPIDISQTESNKEGQSLNEPKHLSSNDQEPTGESYCIDQPCIRFHLDNTGRLEKLAPSALKKLEMGQSVALFVSPELFGKLKVFVRNADLLDWDISRGIIHPKKAGQTEVFVVYEDSLHILPVSISPESSEELVDDAKENRPKVNWSVLQAQTDKAVNSIAQRQTAFRFEKLDHAQTSGKLIVQLLDERSNPELERLYPMKGLTTSIVGLSDKKTSDVRGMLSFDRVPRYSRFFVRVEDQQGRVPPHHFTIQTQDLVEPQIERFKIMGYRSWYLYSKVFGFTQDSNLASLCMQLKSKDKNVSYAGLSASLNLQADGPYYFNDLGPDVDAAKTGNNGRFCFFNVDPGLAEISLFDSDKFIGATSVTLLEGSHSEESWTLGDAVAFELQLAALPSATEQLYQDYDEWFEYQDIDFIDLIAIGENESLPSLESGVLFGSSGYSTHKSRLYALSQASDFETVIYNLDLDQMNQTRGRPVVPLFARGFIEDLFLELHLIEGHASIAFDQALGSVLSYHVLPNPVDPESELTVRLVDANGKQVSTGWVFGSGHDGYYKSVFFNLEPGNYTVIVENTKGQWIDASTVVVDYWSTSFVQTGGFLTKSIGIPN